MIKLTKGPKPNVLQENAADWTTQLLAHVSGGTKVPDSLKNKYNDPEVRAALRRESNAKCMYCESRVNHVTHDHIEHIKPKATTRYPELTFEWSNLGLACPKCNMNKSDDFDEATPFVNPYIDNPSNHLVALGGFVYHVAGDVRGELTERCLDLNRAALLEQRLERIDAIRALADRYQSATEPLKTVLQKEIQIEASSDKPYSLCVASAFAAILAGASTTG